MKALIVTALLAASFSSASPFIFSSSPYITGPDMRIIDKNIIVDISIDNLQALDSIIHTGVEKQIEFTVELLRNWRYWPDEFVVSKKIRKTIQYDNLRGQYRAASDNGVTRIEKHFKDYSQMNTWIFMVDSVNLANIRELEPGSYYIRIIVESKSMKQLPLIGFFMHFIPEVEMTLAKESRPFVVEPAP